MERDIGVVVSGTAGKLLSRSVFRCFMCNYVSRFVKSWSVCYFGLNGILFKSSICK